MPSLFNKCRIIELRKSFDLRGQLVFVESGTDIPFNIKRIYYMYDIPEFINRGGHAHKELQQLFIAMHGSFEVCLDDGFKTKVYKLDNPRYGLYVSPITWREVRKFSKKAVCLVLASEHYDENDYYHNYQEFLNAVKN